MQVFLSLFLSLERQSIMVQTQYSRLTKRVLLQYAINPIISVTSLNSYRMQPIAEDMLKETYFFNNDNIELLKHTVYSENFASDFAE